MAARQWSCESVTAEHRDVAATSFSLSRDGRLAVLAGRRSLALIGLDRPQEVVVRVKRQSQWEAGPVQWNPSHHYSSHVAAVCHDKVEMYVWEEGGGTFRTVDPIRAHTRSVTDIHWNQASPAILATASTDGYIHSWDIR